MFNFKQSNFSQFVSVVPFENTQAKTCLELTTKKDTRVASVHVIWMSFD